MFDWQVNEEEQPLPNSAEEKRPARRMRRWRLWGGLFLLLVMAGLFVFRWRLSERTEAMQADLRAFIRHEEQQRLFGLSEEANELMVSNAPKVWQQAYRLSFAKSDEVQQVELKIEEIELNGTEAYVTVRFDGLDRFDNNESQVRFYRLVGQEWRRAPLSQQFWGEERQLELADEDITIVYPAREEPFVQRLAADLQGLLQQWPAKTSNSTGMPKRAPFTIKIKPSEFAPALLNVSASDDTRQIVLNSLNLMMRPHATDGGVRRLLDGEAGIRFGLADALLEEVDLDYQTQKSLLLGGATFLGAIRNTFILRWALPDEAIPRQIWHDKVKDGWESPFLGQWKINREDVSLERTWEPRLSEATVLLMADYLYDQYGSEALEEIIKQLPTAQSWDRIFYPLTGHYTIELENKMRSANNESKRVAHNAPQLPFSATLLHMTPETGRLGVEVKGQGRRLSIQTASAVLIDAEEANWSGPCAMLHKEVTITEGDWLTVGHELKARQLVISEPEPAIESENMRLAPPDTLAYLAELRDEPERGREAGTFVALSEDGSTTDLMTLPSLMSVGWHTQPKIPWPARFLLTLSVPNCEQAWLLMYDPQQGIVGRWLTPFSGRPGFTWRPREGDFIFRGRYGHGTHSSRNESYLSAQPGEPLRLLGEAENLSHVLGWFGEKMVTINQAEGAVKLMNLKSREVTKSIPLASKNVRSFTLSEDGKHLFYAYGLPPTEKPTLHVLDLESGQDKFVFSASDDEWLSPLSVGADRLLLAVADERAERLADLLLIDLNASPQPTTIMEIPLTEYTTSGLACADNRVLMTIRDEGQTEVRMWQPDGSTKSLLKTDRELTLLSCR